MWAWMDRIGTVLFDATLSTAVFLTCIMLAMLACRQPARRILLARVALLSSLAILPIVGLGRLPRLDVIDTFVESRFFPTAVFLSKTLDETLDEEAEDASAPPVAAGWIRVRLVPHWLADPGSTVVRWFPRGLTLLDLICVATGSAWLMLGLAGVHWLIGRSRPPSPATEALFDELVAGRSGPAARAALRVSARLRHPVVTGLFRPTIMIPEALDRADDPEPLRLSLLHEIAHAERSDHWFSTIASMAQAIWFFLPHVWWLRAQLLIDQEFLADRSAAERYGTSSEYASSLLSLATLPGPEPRNTASRPAGESSRPGTVGVQSPLFQRMMMLLHCPYPVESRTPRLWSWTSRVAVFAASIAAACLVIRWPQSSVALPAAAVSDGSAGPRFQVLGFVAKPMHEDTVSQRSMVYVMPLALPPTFDLDVEVRSTRAELPHVRIVGQPLGVEDPAGLPAIGGTAVLGWTGPDRAWRRVHIHREHHRISVTVDDRPVPPSKGAEASPDWLTIEPPADGPVEFQKLIVNW